MPFGMARKKKALTANAPSAPPRATPAPPPRNSFTPLPPHPLTPSSSPPTPPATPQDLQTALQAAIAGKPALSWVNALEIRKLEERQVTFALRPGQRNKFNFVSNPQQQSRLEALLRQIMGASLRTIIEPPANDGGGEPASPTGTPGSSQSQDRQAAMNLPLVRQAMEIFSDAMIVDVRKEQPATSTPASDAVPANPQPPVADATPSVDESMLNSPEIDDGDLHHEDDDDV